MFARSERHRGGARYQPEKHDRFLPQIKPQTQTVEMRLSMCRRSAQRQ